MRITITEFPDDLTDASGVWDALVEHVRGERSDVVLLPEMPFAPWFAASPRFDAEAWRAALNAHDRWLWRLSELAPAVVLASRPVERDGRRLNEAFVFDPEAGYASAHVKSHLPNEAGGWEATWFERGDGEFRPANARGITVGFQVCSELWFPELARKYGLEGTQLIAVPRATEGATTDKWLAGCRVAAIVSGSFLASSNRRGADFGGTGWVIDPDGQVLATTSEEAPFATVDADGRAVDQARFTYPRSLYRDPQPERH